MCTVLNEELDIHYPIIEMNSRSKVNDIRWNSYIRNHIASSSFDGVAQLLWKGSIYRQRKCIHGPGNTQIIPTKGFLAEWMYIVAFQQSYACLKRLEVNCRIDNGTIDGIEYFMSKSATYDKSTLSNFK